MTYDGEAEYDTSQEYDWCQAHPGQCNMYNNASYRRFNVTGTSSFTFTPVGATVRTTPSTDAWTESTSVLVESEPGVDGRAFVVYKITLPICRRVALRARRSQPEPRSLDPILQRAARHRGRHKQLGFHAHRIIRDFPNDGSVAIQDSAMIPGFDISYQRIDLDLRDLSPKSKCKRHRFGTLYPSEPMPINRHSVQRDRRLFNTGPPITVGIQAPGGGCTSTPTPTATATATATRQRLTCNSCNPEAEP